MHELAFEDLIHGRVVLAFDGHVVELLQAGVGSIARIHELKPLVAAIYAAR